MAKGTLDHTRGPRSVRLYPRSRRKTWWWSIVTASAPSALRRSVAVHVEALLTSSPVSCT